MKTALDSISLSLVDETNQSVNQQMSKISIDLRIGHQRDLHNMLLAFIFIRELSHVMYNRGLV